MGQTDEFAASLLIVRQVASIIHYNLELGAVIIELSCSRSLHQDHSLRDPCEHSLPKKTIQD
jgi:hypothetical protein